MAFRVLELDGGGLKGCILLPQLKILENSLPTGKRIKDVFDLIYGTSTGAIIGSALAAGASVDEITELYQKQGAWIFTPKNSWLLPWRKVTRPLYDRERVLKPLDVLFEKYNVSKAGDLTSKFVGVTVDVCAKPVKINMFLKSWERTDRVLIDEVAKSFAAAMYFGYYRDDIDKTYYEDGGTGTMNCSLYYSLFECVAKFNEQLQNGLAIYSFGCGYEENSLTFDEASNYNNINQVKDVLLDGGEGLAHSQSAWDQVNALNFLQKNMGKDKLDFRRFDIPISSKIDVIDGVKYMNQYFDLGNDYGIQNADRLKI